MLWVLPVAPVKPHPENNDLTQWGLPVLPVRPDPDNGDVAQWGLPVAPVQPHPENGDLMCRCVCVYVHPVFISRF